MLIIPLHFLGVSAKERLYKSKLKPKRPIFLLKKGDKLAITKVSGLISESFFTLAQISKKNESNHYPDDHQGRDLTPFFCRFEPK